MSSTKFVARHGINSLGDLIVTGSITATGGISISGSVTSASFATSASQAQNATSSSFALTSSFANNFTVAGTLTAQTLVVQTITSSIIYSSGSNIFGNSLANTQVLTGSVTVTGSLAVNNSNVILTNQTSSMSVATASFAISASQAANAVSASQAQNAVSSSFASTATSSSYALSSSQATNANNAISSSYALTASFAANVPQTASFAISASQAQNAVSSSFAFTASYAENAGGGAGFPFSGSAVITGSLQITNLTGSGVRYVVTDSDGNITAQQASASILSTQTVTASAGQTVFNITNGYTTGLVNVFVNGTKLNDSEYVDTNGTSITFITGSMLNDVVEFQKYLPALGVTNNALRALTTFTAASSQSIFNIDYTPGLLDIYYNGSRLTSVDYTANNGTSITLATASNAGDILDVMVYSYQVGSFSGIGGGGSINQIPYYTTQNSITGSPNFTINGSTMLITGSLTVSGSGTFTNIGPAVFSGSVIAVDGFTGSFSGTATNAVSASQAQNAVSSSFALTATSASQAQNAISSSFASNAANSNLLDGKDSTEFAITGSNIFTGIQYNTDTSNPNGFGASASIYTDGGVRITKDAYVSGTIFVNNLTVFGTQSINYITSSQLNISTNIISVNTDTPSIRFGGLSVYDSGSTGLTGSMLWDSERDHWVYSNPSGSSYSGGMIMSGPRSSALGSEQGTLNNFVMKGQGGDHITSSQIIDDGTTVRIPGNLQVTGSTILTGALTGSSATFSGNIGLINGELTVKTSAFGGVINLESGTNTNKWLLYHFSSDNTFRMNYNGSGNDEFILSTAGAATFLSTIGTGGDITITKSSAASFIANNTSASGKSYRLVSADDGTFRIQNTGVLDLLTMTSTGAATFSSTVTAAGITSTGTNTMLSISSSTAGLVVRGGSSIGTPALASGQILIGQTTTYRLSLAYDDNTGYAYIDNLYDNANSNIYFRVRTNGTPINALTLFGTGAATFSSSVSISSGNALTLNNSVNSGAGSIICPGGGSLALRSYGNDMIYLNENAEIRFLTSNTERMRITSEGYLKQRANGGSYFNGSYNEISNLAGGGSDINLVLGLGGNSNNTSSYFLICAPNNSGDRLYILGNGNVLNINGSYGTLSSDRRLKENIVTATPKLDDILKLNVVNFNLIGNDEKHIGFIAQEMQEVFPSFVYQNDTRKYDEDGNLISGLEDALGLKVGMEFAILVKAIQEQQAQIEELKAEFDKYKATHP
jgi:hypothetical protein